ncbi:gasdermin-E isoform X2 [Pithys albifrons albifrons]|uniref:gasdermin-E isoform X2 n=1 Tax=Pithys albifrons albifrons TaxID=3385563 RepID=UPI003A5CF146
MFAKATKNFVRETDSGGDLIPVSHLNASDKLQLLSLVTKRRKFWCWQKPKYHFLTVTLSDVLTEDKPIKPVIVESDFAKYTGKFEDFVQGSIEASFVKVSLGTGGKGYVENESSFGNLRKQEIDLQQLMKDVKDRTIDLSSSLLQQVIERKREVLCILREKIVTTQRCTISERIQTEEKVSGVMGCTAKTVKVSVSENGSMVKDSSVILEIPPATTIAYGVIELFIKHNGQFDLSWLKTQFQPFVKLPEDKQRALYKTLCELFPHEETMTALGDVFDDICTGEKPDLEELKLAQQRDLLNFLQLLGCSLQSELLQKYQPQDEELFSAAHLLISALSEMSDCTLVLLRACCDLQVVPALCCLPDIASADGTVALGSPSVAALTDRGRFDVVQRLFTSSNINLEMTESSVKVVTMKEPRFFPLVLYVALYGLHALGGNV